jgi:methanol metabolism-related c-type cytochrome
MAFALRHFAASGLAAAVLALGLGSAPASAQENPKIKEIIEAASKAEKDDTGKYTDADGNPTFHKAEDGTIDWYTYSGFRRYHSECHVCHGPDGAGSSYAPALANSVINTVTYEQFQETVVNGRKNGNSVMPHFGDNQNVMCYLDDIYVYLRARGSDAIPRGRPTSKREEKPAAYGEQENSCLGRS